MTNLKDSKPTKKAIYPGSFNPWHEGHEDVLQKALMVFDEVVIAFGDNPEKPSIYDRDLYRLDLAVELGQKYPGKVSVVGFSGLLVGAIKEEHVAVIRGLRNGYDLQYEQNLQYCNEDLGLKIPVVYFVAGRNCAHVSSTMIRSVWKAKAKPDKKPE